MRITIFGIAAVAFISVHAAAAQEPVGDRPVEIPWQFRAVVNASVEPPPGDGAWVLEVFTRGGFAGTGIGTFSITSSGVTCRQKSAPCAGPLPPDAIQHFADLLDDVGSGSWSPSSPSFCSDCVQTLLLLRKREDGSVQTRVAHWDQSQPIRVELRRLYQAVVRLRGDP